MALHIIIGFDTEKPTSSASVIYCGNSGAEARAAEESNTSSRRFLRVLNPAGTPKNNRNYKPPVAAPKEPEPQPDTETETEPPPEDTSRRGRK